MGKYVKQLLSSCSGSFIRSKIHSVPSAALAEMLMSGLCFDFVKMIILNDCGNYSIHVFQSFRLSVGEVHLFLRTRLHTKKMFVQKVLSR